MTEKQIMQWNRMRAALRCIANDYKTVDQIHRQGGQDGEFPAEAIEMAYDNIQLLAASAVKGIKEAK